MIEPGFKPKTSILGIYGTSYGIQLGEINELLGLVVYRGKDVILFNKFKDITVYTIEDANCIIGWLMNNFSMINVDVFQVSRTVRYLIAQLNINKKN